jgi:WhiB family transcriptional regulator, redox-sensing transcriptional regulator
MPAGRTRKKVLALAAYLPSLPDAVCREYDDPDLWHPDRPNAAQERQAVAVCHSCPEENACLLFAARAHPLPGIWGGTTEAERKRLFIASELTLLLRSGVT